MRSLIKINNGWNRIIKERLGIKDEYIYDLENKDSYSLLNKFDENLQKLSTRENDLFINDNENEERNNLDSKIFEMTLLTLEDILEEQVSILNVGDFQD